MWKKTVKRNVKLSELNREDMLNRNLWRQKYGAKLHRLC